MLTFDFVTTARCARRGCERRVCRNCAQGWILGRYNGGRLLASGGKSPLLLMHLREIKPRCRARSRVTKGTLRKHIFGCEKCTELLHSVQKQAKAYWLRSRSCYRSLPGTLALATCHLQMHCCAEEAPCHLLVLPSNCPGISVALLHLQVQSSFHPLFRKSRREN